MTTTFCGSAERDKASDDGMKSRRWRDAIVGGKPIAMGRVERKPKCKTAKQEPARICETVRISRWASSKTEERAFVEMEGEWAACVHIPNGRHCLGTCLA